MSLMKPLLLVSCLLCASAQAATPLAMDTIRARAALARLDKLNRTDAGGGLAGVDSLMAGLRASGSMPLLAEGLVVRGDALRTLGRYDQAMAEYAEAHALAERSGHADALIRSWMGMAITHLEINDLDKAGRELREALALAAPVDHPLLAKIHLNIGVVHDMQGRTDSALAAYTITERMARARRDSVTLATVLHDIAVVHGMRGDMARSEEFELKALEALPRITPIDLRGKILVTLGSLYADTRRYDKALPMLEECRQEAVKRKAGNVLRAYHQVMAGLHRERGDTARTFEHLNMLMAVRDSLEANYRTQALADAETQFGLTRMERELALSQAEAEASALRAQRGRIAWGALAIIALLAGALVFSFYRRMQLRKQTAMALERDRERLSEENELLHQENLMARFETLKSQIDPHFLFNALNTLYTLVEVEPARARAFIASFSALYRKVLGSRDRTIVPLAEELDLIKHYVFLQRIRFGDSLHIRMEVPASARGFLPPFTLQMLLENAIKHNAISAARPLRIDVLLEGDRILVRNDLRSRGTSTAGTGAGLENIRRRYAMLGAPEPCFTMTDAHYEASVPLMTHEP
jgi:hypothetical protein